MRFLALHHVSINAIELDRTAGFYEQLGLSPIPGANKYVRWFNLGNNELHIIASRSPLPRAESEGDAHFAMEVDDIHAFVAHITKCGGEVLQEPRRRPHDGSWYLFALDPEGNRFELTQHGDQNATD